MTINQKYKYDLFLRHPETFLSFVVVQSYSVDIVEITGDLFQAIDMNAGKSILTLLVFSK